MSDPRKIQTRALSVFLRWLGGASPGASVVEAPGVTAAVVPATPERSVVNSVAYEAPGALNAAYDELAAAYADAGVRAGHAGAEGMAPAIAGAPEGMSLRRYRARIDGETACVLVTADHEDDLGLYLVATGERHRGRGLTTRLLTLALAEGRDRGLRTSSLQSTAKGQPVYERLGYRERFRIHMYEHRR